MKWRTRYSPIGLDIGSRQLKMAQLKMLGQSWAVHHLAVAPLPGADDPPAEASEAQIVQGLHSMLATGAFVGKKVVSALPCAEVDIRTVPIPAETDPQDIQRVIRQEAEAYLAYSIEEAILECRLTEEAQHDDGAARRALVVATPRAHVDHHLALLQQAGLYCVALEVLPLALNRLLVRHQHIPTTSPLLVIDLGYRYSTACILWQDSLMYTRTLSWGGGLLTQAIVKELKLSDDKAEHLKQQYGIDPQTSALPTMTTTSQHINPLAISGLLWEVLRPQLETLAAELERLISYWGARFRGALINRLYLSGGSAALPGLEAYLRQRMGIDVTVIEPLSRLATAQNTAAEPYQPTPQSSPPQVPDGSTQTAEASQLSAEEIALAAVGTAPDATVSPVPALATAVGLALRGGV